MISRILLSIILIGATVGCGKQAEDFVRLLRSGSESSSTMTGVQSLTWSATTPTYDLNVSSQWTAATNATSLRIQYYSDGTCATPSGAPVTLTGTATSHAFSGSNQTTYSYIVTSYDAKGNSIASACSAAVTLDTDACVGTRLTNTPYAKGTGTVVDPYLICTAAQMNAIGLTSTDWNKNFKLGSDISLAAYTGTQYNIIGTSGTNFTGVFDGDGHTISNFSYTSNAVGTIGLFGNVSGAAVIRNLVLTGGSLTVTRLNLRMGFIVGSMLSGTLSNITVTGTITQTGATNLQSIGGLVGEMDSVTGTSLRSTLTMGTSRMANFGGIAGYVVASTLTSVESNISTSNGFIGATSGGIAGYVQDSTITRASATGNIHSSASQYVGGLIGSLAEASNLSESYSTVTVVGYSFGTGGLVGILGTTAGNGISNCYATGSVEGSANPAGGLVGVVSGYAGNIITNSYASGFVTTSTGTRGGLVGQDSNGGVRYGVYTASYWNSQVNPTLSGFGTVPAAPAGVISANTATLQLPATFSGNGWTSPTWNLTTSGMYLKLGWQP